MCMEDIRIGRKKIYQVTDVYVPNGTVPLVQLVGRNAYRTALILSQNGATEYSLSLEANAGGLAFMEVNQYNNIVTLDVEIHGQLVMDDVYVYVSGGNSFFRVIEVILREA